MKTIAVVNAKGAVTIPVMLRGKFKIRKGTRVSIVEDGRRIVLQPLTRGYVRGLRGALKGELSALTYLIEGRRGGSGA